MARSAPGAGASVAPPGSGAVPRAARASVRRWTAPLAAGFRGPRRSRPPCSVRRPCAWRVHQPCCLQGACRAQRACWLQKARRLQQPQQNSRRYCRRVPRAPAWGQAAAPAGRLAESTRRPCAAYRSPAPRTAAPPDRCHGHRRRWHPAGRAAACHRRAPAGPGGQRPDRSARRRRAILQPRAIVRSALPIPPPSPGPEAENRSGGWWCDHCGRPGRFPPCRSARPVAAQSAVPAAAGILPTAPVRAGGHRPAGCWWPAGSGTGRSVARECRRVPSRGPWPVPPARCLRSVHAWFVVSRLSQRV